MNLDILGQVALGYSPLIARDRHVLATRLTVFPREPGRAPPLTELLQVLGQLWRSEHSRVALALRSETLLAELLAALQAVPPDAHLMVEVPRFLAMDPALAPVLEALGRSGVSLLLAGRPDAPLPPAVVAAFRYAVVDLAEERRHAPAAPGAPRSLAFVQDGVQNLAQMRLAFERGAAAVLGWPIDELADGAPGRARTPQAARPDLAVLLQLISAVDREEPLDRLEALLKRDPTLAYKLLSYINSPLFGLRVEISSFSHAVMLLGYQRLRRWLALLLVTAGDEPDLRPVMYASVRRGLLMEALMPEAEEGVKGELFICGVFSLLDRLFRQPFAELLDTLPVPEAVRAALLERSGPYRPILDIARALEGTAQRTVQQTAEAAMLDLRAVNRALVHALSAAVELG